MPSPSLVDSTERPDERESEKEKDNARERKESAERCGDERDPRKGETLRRGRWISITSVQLL